MTDEVRAKVSVMESLEEVARLWVVYEEEKRAYHRLSTFQWKNSSINAGMSDIKSLVSVVKDSMVAGASLQISQAMILTPGMITRKMNALTALVL